MKKLIFTILTTTVTTGLFAQLLTAPKEPTFQYTPKVKTTKVTTYNKTNISSWYNNLDMVAASNVGAFVTGQWAFSNHDSLPKIIFSNGVQSNPTWMSFGQVMDPKDDVLDNTDFPEIKLSKYVSYKVDSMRFTYCYVRNVDSIDDGMGGMQLLTDTMFVYSYRGNQISKYQFTESKDNLALVGYNTTTRKGQNFVKVDTILLTTNTGTRLENNDQGVPESKVVSATYTLATDTNLMRINANNGIETNNLVGALVVFRSGQKATYNNDLDTVVLVNQTATPLPPEAKRGNCLMFLTVRNEGEVRYANKTHHSTSQMGVKWAAYGQDDGWPDGVVSGNAFTQEAFVDFDFLITTTSDNVGISEIKNDAFAMSSVYPNPATANDKVLVAFNLKDDAKVNVSIMNIFGQEVKTFASKNYASGSSVAEFDLAGLNTGVYFVNMTVNGSTITKKLTITK